MKPVREVRSIDSVGCWTDGYITIDKGIFMVSLFGSPARVNAIRAIILKGETVYLQDCWSFKNAFPVKRADKKLKAINRQLAPGVAHCLIYAPQYLEAKEASPEKILFGDSEKQILEKFFHVVQKHYSTPFLPAWTDWLLGQMEQMININALGFNQVLGLKFPEEEDLEARLFEAGAPLSGGGHVHAGQEKIEQPLPMPSLSDAVATDAEIGHESGYTRLIDLS